MEAADVNGGNAEVARDEPNLEAGYDEIMPESQREAIADNTTTNVKMEETGEVNGDVKSPRKKVTPVFRRKLRKFKTNSTSNVETDAKPHTRGQKRKVSEPDDVSSEDSTEFNGFDTQLMDTVEPGTQVLQKLIAEAESAESPQTKRRRRSTSKIFTTLRNLDDKEEDTDVDDAKFDPMENVDMHKIKKDKESDTDSIGLLNSLDSELDPLKTDESSVKSANSSANSSPSGIGQKLKIARTVRVISPGGVVKQKISVDMSNPLFREPFKYGWKRELVFRAGSDHAVRRMADIYYYTPKGKKVRSFREVAEFLNTKELTIDNFTFFKEPLGVNNPDFEIIRDARVRDSTGPIPTPPKKHMALKKTAAKKSVEKPLTPPPPAKVAAKSPKVTPAGFKIKLPGKRGQPKKVTKSPPKEPEMLPPQWNSPASTRRNQAIVEKPPPAKPKRVLKKKIVPLETDQRHFMVSVCGGYDALSRIFQYLKVQELLRAARVCKMWRDLAAHSNLWKTVRMKNSQVTDWDGLADSLKRHGTQHLDLRKMLVAGESDGIWKKFVTVIPRVTSLLKLELCRCPVMVVEEVIKSCPQLEILSAMSIKCDSLKLESVGNLKACQELRLKAISGMSLHGDLSPLEELTQLTHLSLTSVKELGKKKVDILASLINLETLELGECSDFPDKFGTAVLLKLEKLERLRLEKGQGTCCTFDILEGVSKLETLNQLELVNFDVKNGFDKCLSNCKNIKRLLIIPTYISQSATSNNMVLGGVTELSNNLTHFVWGVTLELLRVTELFVDQCNQMNKQVTGDSIPVLKPVPCLKLIEDVEEDTDPLKDEKPQPNLTNPQVDILPLPQLQKLLLTALPKTRVKILKIPFHATWRQSISDTTTQ